MTLVVRDCLAEFVGQRLEFEGEFERGGTRIEGGVKRGTMCFFAVQTGDIVLDHAWVDVTRELLLLNLRPGDVVRFSAEVQVYSKIAGLDWGLDDVQDVERG